MHKIERQKQKGWAMKIERYHEIGEMKKKPLFPISRLETFFFPVFIAALVFVKM